MGTNKLVRSAWSLLAALILVMTTGGYTFAASAGSTGVNSASSMAIDIGVRAPVTGSMLPYVSRSIGMHMILRQQYATLLHLGAKLQLEPELVNDWWYADGGKEVYMKINPHAVWSDGTPITAQDVALAVDFLASPTYNDTLSGAQGYRVLPIVGAQAVMNGQTQTVSGFHIVNAQEFYFTLTQADPSVMANDLQGIMPLPAQVFGSVPMTQWAQSPFATDPTVGSGPYLVTQGPPGEVDMLANPTFILGDPHIEELKFKEVPPIAARGLLEAGALDVYADVPIQSVSDLSGVNGSVIDSVTGSAVQALAWNDQQAGPSSRLFRQAIMYAINRPNIIQSVLSGEATLQNGPLPSDSVWSDAALSDAYTYDPQEARDLLIKAGFYIGNKDWLVRPGGAPLDVTINYAQGDPYGEQLAQAIAANLQNVAIDARARGPLTEREMMTEMMQPANPASPNVAAYLVGWTLGADPDPRGVWGSQDIYNQDLFHWTNVTDPSVLQNDQLIAEQVSATDDSLRTRQATLDQWQALLSASVPVDFLYSYDQIGVTSSRMDGVVWSGLRGPIDTWKWSIGQP